MRTVTSLRCHLWVLLAIAVDIGVAVLVVITNKQDILVPHPKNNVTQALQNYLPAFGTLIGVIIAVINKNAISALMTVEVKRKIVSSGLTLKQIGYYDTIGMPALGSVRLLFVD